MLERKKETRKEVKREREGTGKRGRRGKRGRGEVR